MTFTPVQQRTYDLLAKMGPCTVLMATRAAHAAGDNVSRDSMARRLAELHKHVAKPTKRWPGTRKKLVVYGIAGSELPESLDRTKNIRNPWIF